MVNVCLALAMLSGGRCEAASATITVKDITPKFLTFYREVERLRSTPDQRWVLWKSLYDFAAVPPTPEGDRIARGQLDGTWSRYTAALPRIEQGAAGLSPSPQTTIDTLVALFHPDEPVQLRLLVYVGSFDGNAFTTASGPRRPTVALPVEQDSWARGPIMAHEFTHAVQIAMGSMAGGWQRTIGETVLAEGLAMRAAAQLYPDRPALSFVEVTPGWFARAEGMRHDILQDVRASLTSDQSEDVMRFTMGKGRLGIDREAYYAGWLVAGYWLTHGKSFADIIRIVEAEAPKATAEAIDALEQ